MRPVRHHIHRLRLADGAGQALRAAHAGHDAERDLGLAELGLVGGDDEVAHHRELAAAAEREARHRGDDRLAGAAGTAPSRAKKSATIHVDDRSCSAISLMSAPAAKAFSEPVSTMQPIARVRDRAASQGHRRDPGKTVNRGY